MKKNNYVWYLCYGSNLLYERFMCYIEGGYCINNQNTYKGCTDKSAPLRIKSKVIHHEMYFAGNSSKWGNGGVCFLRKEENEAIITYARMYLITEEQFEGVMIQEGAWYTHKLELGTEEGFKIYTFTNENQHMPLNKPNESYLQTIQEGLHQAYPELSKEDIKKYLNQ